MVLDECSRLVADSQEKSNTKVEELNSEIRKLKAMIGKFFLTSITRFLWNDLFPVKHETRIRTLETKNKEQEKMLISNGIMLNNNGHNDLDPDEVWCPRISKYSVTNQDITSHLFLMILFHQYIYQLCQVCYLTNGHRTLSYQILSDCMSMHNSKRISSSQHWKFTLQEYMKTIVKFYMYIFTFCSRFW